MTEFILFLVFCLGMIGLVALVAEPMEDGVQPISRYTTEVTKEQCQEAKDSLENYSEKELNELVHTTTFLYVKSYNDVYFYNGRCLIEAHLEGMNKAMKVSPTDILELKGILDKAILIKDAKYDDELD